MWKFAQYSSKNTNAYSHKLLAALCSTVSLYQTLPVNKTHATRISYGIVYRIWTLNKPYLRSSDTECSSDMVFSSFPMKIMRYFSKKFYSNFYQGFEVKKFVSVIWSRMKLRKIVKKAHMIRFQACWVLVIELQNNQLRYIHWNVLLC